MSFGNNNSSILLGTGLLIGSIGGLAGYLTCLWKINNLEYKLNILISNAIENNDEITKLKINSMKVKKQNEKESIEIIRVLTSLVPAPILKEINEELKQAIKDEKSPQGEVVNPPVV